jgi:hypothetical protein
MTAAAIASGIDTSTVAGHNLRALLLRAADGDESDDVAGPEDAAMDDAAGRGLIYPDCAIALTPLGREVAERLRPEPWEAEQEDARTTRLFDPAEKWVASFDHRDGGTGLADRIAALLTADDLRAAKAYRVEP